MTINETAIANHQEEISRRTIAAHWFGFSFTGFLGIVGLITNLLVIVVTVFWKPLHTKCQINLASHAVANIVSCLFYAAYGLQRFMLHLNNDIDLIISYQCQLQFCVTAFGFFASSQAQVVLSLDRLFAVTIPVQYRNWSKRYLITVNSISWGLAVVEVLWVFPLMNYTETIPSCTYKFSNPGYVQHLQLAHACCNCTVVIVLQAVLLTTLRKKLRQARQLNQNVKQLKKQLEAKAAKAVLAALVWNFACMGGTTVFSNLGLLNDDVFIGEMWYAWCNVFIALAAAGNFFVYLAVQSEFRRGCKGLFRCSFATSVKPLDTSVTRTTRIAPVDDDKSKNRANDDKSFLGA